MSTRARILTTLAAALVGLALFGLTIGGCDQADGERCQRTEDCASGLTCNLGTQLCQQGLVGTGVPPIDAPLDAEEPDAAPDASPDAAPDASPL